MKIKLIFLFIPMLLLGFKVEFTKIYKNYICPNKDAVLIQTKVNNLTFPFPFFKTKNGYVLYTDMQQINNYLNNEFYAPKNTKYKNIKIRIINTDRIQYKIIQKIKNTYKQCKIKKIIFLSPDQTQVIFKPTWIKEKYKIILDCK